MNWRVICGNRSYETSQERPRSLSTGLRLTTYVTGVASVGTIMLLIRVLVGFIVIP